MQSIRLISIYIVLALLSACVPVKFSDISEIESTRIYCEAPEQLEKATNSQPENSAGNSSEQLEKATNTQYDDADLSEVSDSTNISVFVDGTPSMAGYTSNPNSTYVLTLEQIDSILEITSQGENSFFRLGQHKDNRLYKSISRAQFYSDARLNSFYEGNGNYEFLQVSKIDAAISEANGKNGLTVIITDLYQSEEDVTAISKRIKDVYFNKENDNAAIGILGLRSQFDGKIYIEEISRNSSSNWSGKRPFYILVLGQFNDVEDHILQLMTSLDLDSDLGEGINTTIFSPVPFMNLRLS